MRGVNTVYTTLSLFGVAWTAIIAWGLHTGNFCQACGGIVVLIIWFIMTLTTDIKTQKKR